jgi:3-methyladenine DNA glycosylase Tag
MRKVSTVKTRPNQTPTQDLPALTEVVAAMARVVFQSGMGAQVVDAKWDGIEAAFGGFDPHAVAGLNPADIDRLCADPRVIRNRRKLEAIAANAGELLDWELGGGVRAHLDQMATDADREAEVIRRLKFVGPAGAREFLWLIGAVESMGCER